MNLGDFYPQPHELVDNELETVNFLAQNTYLGEQHDFVAAASKSHKQYSPAPLGFQFSAPIEVFHTGLPGGPRLLKKVRPAAPEPNTRLIIGATIEQTKGGAYGNISYCLAVCRIHSKHSSILRKFHFDITASTDRRQPHPISHMQYCGEMIGIMAQLGYKQEQLSQLHTKVREPRVLFWPMSLALLIDLAVREFPDPRLTKFRLSPEWRNVVRKNEELLLKPFYEKCVEIISDSSKGRGTLADKFYLD